jgi:hypothetical protein
MIIRVPDAVRGWITYEHFTPKLQAESIETTACILQDGGNQEHFARGRKAFSDSADYLAADKGFGA